MMKQELFRINDKIRARQVRLIDAKGLQVGVVTIERARFLATESGLDLVEVQATANPPVCKILDYGKYKYELKKKAKDSKKKQEVYKQKEIQLSYNIAEHDIIMKKNHARQFLVDNCKVFFTMRLRGREKEHFNHAADMFAKIKEELADVAKVYSDMKREGNTINMLLVPSGNAPRPAEPKPQQQKPQAQPTAQKPPAAQPGPSAAPSQPAQENKGGQQNA